MSVNKTSRSIPYTVGSKRNTSHNTQKKPLGIKKANQPRSHINPLSQTTQKPIQAKTAPSPHLQSTTRKATTIGLQLTKAFPSSTLQNGQAISVTKNTATSFCTHEQETFWKGKPYKLTLNIPVSKGTKENEPAFQEAVKKFGEAFLKDLEATLANGDIPSGKALDILFNEGGYIVKLNEPLEKSAGNTNAPLPSPSPISIQAETSKELSTLIRHWDPKKCTETLNKPIFATYQPQKAPVARSLLSPVNLSRTYGRNCCYINAPLQLLANDPFLKEELSNPKNFKVVPHLKENPLYTALQGYYQSQTSGQLYTPDSLFAQHIGLDPNVANDVDVAWSAFEEQIDFNQLEPTSVLNQIFSHKLTITPDQASSVTQLQQTVELLKQEKDCPWTNDPTPKEFVLFVRRTVDFYTAQESFGDKEKKELIDKIVAIQNKEADIEKLLKDNQIQIPDSFTEKNWMDTRSNIYNLCNLDKDKEKQKLLLTSVDTIYYLKLLRKETKVAKFSETNTTQIADQLIGNREAVKAARQLSEEIRDSLKTHLKLSEKRINTPIKAATLIDSFKGQNNVPGHELHGFCVHIPERHHYISYLRSGSKYVKIDDLKGKDGVTDVAEKEWEENIQQASFFIFRQEDLSVKPSIQPPTIPGKQKNNQTGKTKQSSTDVYTETGNIAGLNRDVDAVINWTDPELRSVDSAFGEDTDSIQDTLKDARATDKVPKQWLGFSDKIAIQDGSGFRDPTVVKSAVVDHDGKKRNVLSVVLPQEQTLKIWKDDQKKTICKKAIKTALEKARDNQYLRIAIPLPAQLNAKTEWIEEAIREFIEKNKTHKHQFSAVTIILPPSAAPVVTAAGTTGTDGTNSKSTSTQPTASTPTPEQNPKELATTSTTTPTTPASSNQQDTMESTDPFNQHIKAVFDSSSNS